MIFLLSAITPITRLTATNLFQVVGGKENCPLIINGKEVKGDRVESLNLKKKDAWLIAPNTTGYYIPAGNDSLIVQSVEQYGSCVIRTPEWIEEYEGNQSLYQSWN